MITYLPSPDFAVTARCLVTFHLGQCIQLATWLAKRATKQHRNTSVTGVHKAPPATAALWRLQESQGGGYLLGHLRKYQTELCREWIRRGHAQHLSYSLGRFMDSCLPAAEGKLLVWDASVHASHRARLANNPEYGAQYRNRFDLFGLDYGSINPTGLDYTRPLVRSTTDATR
jgi:hypothetical protein